MSDLVEFLLARVAEDEAVAREATPGPWVVDSPTYPERISGPDGTAPVAGGRWGGEATVFDCEGDAHHIARHDPARVLAECEAKRRIVDVWREADRYGGDAGAFADDILRALALPYAAHEGYREEWRP